MNQSIARRSLYTIAVPLSEKGGLLINSMTGAVDEVDAELFEAVAENTVDRETESYFLERGHFTRLDSEREKTLALAVWSELDKRSRGEAQIVICPTMDCNFRCTYCFQRSLQGRIDEGSFPPPQIHMTEDQVDRIFASYRQIEEYHGRIADHVTLFGGEPLWRRNYKVVARIVSEARKRGQTVSAITNGYELAHFADLLGGDGISHIQVSLDGLPSHHDKVRVTVDGGGSFARILDQLKQVIHRPGLKCGIRMNYDSSNLRQVSELLLLLSNEGIYGLPNVEFHANLISMNHAGEFKEYCTLKELPKMTAEIDDAFQLDCYMSSLRDRFADAMKKRTPLIRRAHYCSATAGMYVFCPDEKVYSCWESIGEDHSVVGTFNPAFSFHEPGLTRWHGRNALAMPKCQTCSHLFLCGGGCAIHALERSGDINASECDGFKKKFGWMVRSHLQRSDRAAATA
jgi:uncharacterized protein